MKTVRLRALLMLVLLAFSSLMYAQGSRLKGIVRDSNGEPLAGVSVAVKGTTSGTITDVNGNFYLENEVNSQTVLVVSFIGMQTQEIKVGNKRDFKIVLLESSQVLEDVVVTGFRSISKTNFTL